MPLNKALRARNALVTIVASYDHATVRKTAVENSNEFQDFLKKNLVSDNLDSLDIMDITTELEDLLCISIPDQLFNTWQQFFDAIINEMNKE